MSPHTPTRAQSRSSSRTCTVCGGPITLNPSGRQPSVCSPECHRARDAARKRLRRDPVNVSFTARLRAAYPDGRPDVAAFTDAEWSQLRRVAAEQYPDALRDNDMDAAHRGIALARPRRDIVTEADFDTLNDDDSGERRPAPFNRSSYLDQSTGAERAFESNRCESTRRTSGFSRSSKATPESASRRLPNACP